REDSLRWACGRPESRFGGVVIWTMSLMFCSGAQPVVQTVQYSDLTPAVQRMLHSAEVDGGNFAQYIADIERRTAERQREGENDHLIFYVLQSKEFTKSARLEPALCAKQYVESGTISRLAQTRMRQFVATAPIPKARSNFHHLFRRNNPLPNLEMKKP